MKRIWHINNGVLFSNKKRMKYHFQGNGWKDGTGGHPVK
jgi:hypothetical protein